MTRNLLHRVMKIGIFIAGAMGLPVSAAGLGDATNELLNAGKVPYGAQPGNTKSLSETVGGIIGLALEIVGTLFLLLMIYGGFLWMTGRGEPDKVKKAKELIIDAVVGIVIIFAAYIITNFVVTSLIAR